MWRRNPGWPTPSSFLALLSTVRCCLSACDPSQYSHTLNNLKLLFESGECRGVQFASLLMSLVCDVGNELEENVIAVGNILVL